MGPKLPIEFLQSSTHESELQLDAEKVELLGDSYKRPRRQKAAEPLHPADERK